MASSKDAAQQSVDGGSSLEDFSGEKVPSRAPRALMWAGLIAVILVGGYVAGQWAVADKTASNASVAGVPIGGMSAPDAIEALEAGLKSPAVEPIAVQAGKQAGTLDPKAAGLSIDAKATVHRLTGFSLAPDHLWNSLFGGGPEELIIVVDDAAFGAQLETLAESMAVAPSDGNVVFAEGTAQLVDAEDGHVIEQAGAKEEIVSNWLLTADVIELPVEAEAPLITQAEAETKFAEAKQFISAPVAVSIADQIAELPVKTLSAAAKYEPNGASLDLTLDVDAIEEAVRSRTKDLEASPSNAKFVFKKGKPVITGGKNGAKLDGAVLVERVRDVATTKGERTAAVDLKKVKPEQTKKSLEELGVNEIVAEFTTPLGASDAARIHNLQFGSKKVTGNLILPGDTWSLTDALSPITAEGGYQSAGIVNNGVLTDGVGGGLSQMATTTYNVGFFLGLEDVEHRPHSYWFSRYPEGREATIFVGSIDMKFKNDTPHGILMQAFVKDGSLTVRGWSSPHYRVETTTSPRRDVTSPKTTYTTVPNCISQGTGSPGFAVTVTRRVFLKDELIRDESNAWQYRAQDAIVCRTKPAPKPPEKKSDEKSSDGKKKSD